MSLDLSEFKNKHVGEIAFILGAGPSLHNFPVNLLKPHITFAVNSSIMKFPQSSYFVSDDSAAADWNWFQSTLKQHRGTKFLLKPKLENLVEHLDDNEISWFDHVEEHSPDFNPNCDTGYKFEEADGKIIAARTSAGTAVHLAWIMGCRKIVLVGCDACHYEGKRYFWQFPGEKKAFRPNHSKPPWLTADKGIVKGRHVDQHCLDFCSYWKKVADNNKDLLDNVYCISDIGILDVFPKASLKQILNSHV